MTEKEEFLAHYGVKGMKWGVRRQNRKKAVAKARRESHKSGREARQASRDYRAAKKAGVGQEAAKEVLVRSKAVHIRNLEQGVRTKSGAATVGLMVATAYSGAPLTYPANRIALRVAANYYENKAASYD